MSLRRIERSLLPIVAILMILILWPVLREVWIATVYDDRPPAVLHSVTIHTPQVPVGGEMVWTSLYSKRAECTPPEGSGEVRYRIVGSPESDITRHNIYELDFRREARWPAGSSLTFRSTLQLPPDIPPGNYMVFNLAHYDCKGASKVLHVTPAAMPLTITPR